MYMSPRIVIQFPTSANHDDSARISCVANAIGCEQFEAAGAVEDFLSHENSQGLISRDLAEDPNRAVHVTAWYLTGFVDCFDADGLDGAANARLIRLIERAGQQGVERISFAPAQLADLPGATATYAKALNRTAAMLATVMCHAERCGVCLCLRPATGRFLTSPVELRELVRDVNSSMVGIDLPMELPAGVPGWSDWFGTLEPLIRCVRVQAGMTESADAVAANVDGVLELIRGINAPRRYEGEIVVSLDTGDSWQ